MQATMSVLVLPPREDCRRRVSLESRYGMCLDLPSTRAEMTFPRAERERLILVASFSRSPKETMILQMTLRKMESLSTTLTCLRLSGNHESKSWGLTFKSNSTHDCEPSRWTRSWTLNTRQSPSRTCIKMNLGMRCRLLFEHQCLGHPYAILQCTWISASWGNLSMASALQGNT